MDDCLRRRPLPRFRSSEPGRAGLRGADSGSGSLDPKPLCTSPSRGFIAGRTSWFRSIVRSCWRTRRRGATCALRSCSAMQSLSAFHLESCCSVAYLMAQAAYRCSVSQPSHSCDLVRKRRVRCGLQGAGVLVVDEQSARQRRSACCFDDLLPAVRARPDDPVIGADG